VYVVEPLRAVKPDDGDAVAGTFEIQCVRHGYVVTSSEGVSLVDHRS